MATIRIFNDIFDDKSRDFIYDTSKPLLEQIEEHLDKDYYKSTMVECYDPDTKKTFYAPMEDENEKEGIILYANGESVTETYRPSENDIVNVIFTPLSDMSNAGWGALIGLGAGVALGLMTGGVGFTALFPALTWTAGNVAFATVVGGALGALIGWTIGDKIDQMQKAGGPLNDKKTGEQLPDVRGCSNQSLLGNNFPFVIGKHLVTPFIIGDPYTEYSGERGEDAYIRELLCVGYGPLKLTDFKLGDFMLAYNRSHNNITKDTMIAGLLKGYSTGGVADNGDIVDYWSKNDVELEIIQQPDGAEVISIDPYFQDRTKIDLSQRPLVSSETMNAAGWNVPAGETCTVYSQGYSNQDESVTVLMTPINPDGTVLTPSELAEYADDCLNSGDLVSNATVDYNVSYNPAPYNEPYVVNSLSVSLNFSITDITEVQVQINNNWTTVLSLPAGAVTASLSESARWPGTDCRIKIGDWVSAHFSINGTGSKIVETPEGMTILPHPYNLLATFTGSDSVQQSEDYAQALHENQEDYYFNRDCIGYGSIYTEVTKESVSDANIFFLSDKSLDESIPVVYKGSSFPNQFRTNTVILSEACPRQFTINLDFPSGLYSTYTQTVNDSTETKYAKIPLWMCIQWRIYNSTKTSSDPKGTDYDDWNTIDFGPSVNKVFSTSEQNNDKAKHKGNNFDNLSLDDLYQGFRGKTLQNFEYYSGEAGLSEFRVSATVTLTKEQCKQVMADTNPARIIEIRVLRVSPNYLNQTTNDSDTVGPYSYSDHVKVLTTVVKTFDMEALRNDDELKPVRVLSEKDLKKLCLVAIKAKADKAGYLQNNMESITCTAESFSPIWDSESKKILPERTIEGVTEKITKVRKYYGYFEGNTDIKANRTDAAYERELTGPNAKEQYEEARHEGKDWYMEKAGSNFPALIKDEVFDDPVLHNDTLCWYLPQRAEKYNNNLASSGALLALFGEQSGPEAIGLEDLNIVAFSDWAEKSAAVNDGTEAPIAMDYNGHHYNKGDLIPVRYEANAYIYQGTKIEDMLQKLAFCGRAAWVIDEAGQVKFIMDAPVDYTKGAINAQNCISSSNAFNYEEPPAGLFITFHDENDGYENNSFYVWTDGNSASRYHGSVEQMSMDYVTNNVQVTSLARYTLASRVQNKEVLTRKVGPNGIIYSLGDVVLVQSDELLIGDVSGRIQEVIENNGTIYGFIMDSDYEYTAELDSNNVNSNQGVTIIQPSYMGKSNAVTLPLSSPRTQSVPLDYEQVYPVGTENPQAEGWYVKNGDQYVLTTDTTVNDEHTYYKAIMVNYTLQKGLTNIVLFGKVIGDQYGVPRDTSEDYSAKTDIKYNFKTGDVAMMGLIEKISAPYRISKIKPEAGGKFTETLIPYDESFYNYGKALPTFQSYITPPQVIADSVPLSEVPTTLKEQNDTLQAVYNAIGVPYDPVPPALPSSISITASRDYISLAWVNTSPNVKHTIIELSKQNGDEGTWTQVAVIDSNNWRYNFNRSTDGYPEADSGTNKLSTWRFRFKNVSICDVESAFTTAQSVTYTNYGTWIPATPSFASKIPSEGGITFNWSELAGQGNITPLYGTQKYTVTVKYEDTDHSVSEITLGTLVTNTVSAVYNFNRASNRDGYPEKIATADYKGLNKYKFILTVENESGNPPVSSGEITFTNDEAAMYKTWIPSAPVITKCLAEEDGITFEWDDVSDCYGVNYYTIAIPDAEGDIPQTLDSTRFFYAFLRSAEENNTTVIKDGYPEPSDLVDWSFTVTAVNSQTSRPSSGTTDDVDISVYLGWLPNAPVVESRSSGRTSTISSINRELRYGKIMYKILVCNPAIDYDEQGGERTYKYYLPVPTSDPYGAETNYKGNAESVPPVLPQQNVPILTGSSYSQTMPLKDQTATKYKRYQFKFEYLKVNPQGTENPQEEGWYEYVYSYNAVTPVGTENPQEEGWYEYNGSDYVLTTDTTIVSGKTYYERSGSYVQTTDTTVDVSKTYYEPNYYEYDRGSSKLLIYTDTVPPSSATQHDVRIDGVLVEDAYCWTETVNNEMVNYISFEVSMPSPKDTTYWWRVYAYNATTESLQSKTSTNYTDAETTVFATSAYDVVKAGITENALAPDAVTMDKIAAGSITAQKILVESLAAISANLGAITDGSLVGSQNNYWYLSDEYNDQHQLVHRAGDFRVGGGSGDDFISCETSDGEHYHVEIHASQFNITAIGTVVKGEFYVSPTTATIDPGTGIPSSYFAKIGASGVVVNSNLIVDGSVLKIKEPSPGTVSLVEVDATLYDSGSGAHYGRAQTKKTDITLYGKHPTSDTEVVGVKFSGFNYYDPGWLYSKNFKVNEMYVGDYNIDGCYCREGLHFTYAKNGNYYTQFAIGPYYTVGSHETEPSGSITFYKTHLELGHPEKILLDATTQVNGDILASNTPIFGTVYSAGTYSSGYFLLAQLEGDASSENHDVGMAGRVLKDYAGTVQISDFYIYARGNNATVGTALFVHTGVKSKAPLVATYEVFSTNRYRIRLYGQITNNWQKFNTVIHYASGGDVSTRVSNLNVTFPNTQSSAVTGTAIGETTTLDGNATSASYLKTYSANGNTDLECLQNIFDTVPKSVGTAVRLQHGSHSMAFGWFLSGYAKASAYGGWFISNYGTPSWVGVANGTWNTQTFVTSKNIGSQSVNYANSSGSCSGNAATATTATTANRDSGGAWIAARDNCVARQLKQTRDPGTSWNPVIGIKTWAGHWSMGTVGGETLCLSYDTDYNYTRGSNRSAVIYFPTAGTGGTIALTSSDITGNAATATTANKIRVGEPASKSNGDIWIQ